MILPGNGNDGDDITKNHWYSHVTEKLQELGVDVILENMPDPDIARMKYWIPFIEKHLQNEEGILIGHSSGAVAAMRYLEKHKLVGAVLIGACHTDLGIEKEKQAGYYDEPWNWDLIKKNSQWIIQFHSINDPFIPIEEARFVAKKLNTEYHELNQGHFSRSEGKLEFPELIKELKKKL